jgi:hypothetical protein
LAQRLQCHARRVVTNFEHPAARIAPIIFAVKSVLAVAAVFDALEKRRCHPKSLREIPFMRCPILREPVLERPCDGRAASSTAGRNALRKLYERNAPQ